MTDLAIVICIALVGAAWVICDLLMQTDDYEPDVSSAKWVDYDFVVRCLRSCETMEQYHTCVKLTELYEAKHCDECLQESLYEISEDVYKKLKK